MNISKVFGFVLCLHLGVIAILIMQPGCRTTQPPTKVVTQDLATESTDMVEPIPSMDSGIDPAFNAGFESTRSTPMRPSGDFSEFSGVQPLEPLSGGMGYVDIAGSSMETYTVKKGDSLWKIANTYDVSVNELYEANGLSKNSIIKVGQQIQIPVEGSSAMVSGVNADTYQPTSLNMSTETYTVKSGDSLSKIARQYGTTVQAIKATNGKSSDVIRIGEKLTIPVAGGSVPASSAPSASVSFSSTPAISTGRTHTVKAGEYPGTIAKQYGMTTAELLAVNGITDPRSLQVGQKLQVSATGRAANVDSSTSTVTGGRTSVPAASSGPVEIRVIEADPLVESEVQQMEVDSMFENAVEIPVIRLEDGQ
jgi:LysM repeat protein